MHKARYPTLALKALQRTSVCRTVYCSARCHGWCIVLRGSRLRMGRGARIPLGPGVVAHVGHLSHGAGPASLSLYPDAQLTIRGTVKLNAGHEGSGRPWCLSRDRAGDLYQP